MVALRQGALSACCADLGLSREALSRQMGISPTTLYRLDRGDVQPSARVIGLLLQATGRAFEDIFEIDGGGGSKDSGDDSVSNDIDSDNDKGSR